MSIAAAKLREWRERPITFVREVLKAEPDPWQADFLEAFPLHSRLALKSCKGPGKSAVSAWLGWNFLATRPHPKVVATSISGDNLRDGLWTEFAKWQQRSDLLKAGFTWGAERIVNKQHPETWWASARQWNKTADASQQANTLAGIHGDYVLILVDEAGGVPSGVVVAADAALANADETRGTEAKLVLTGNPTHLSGPLYEACTTQRALYFVMEITSDPDDPKRTPRVSIQWAREQITKHGRENPWVLVNVFGKFPPGQSNTLLGVEQVAEAAKRTLNERDFQEEPKIFGVDVARFGDDETCIMMRQGRACFAPKSFRNIDLMQTAGEVALAMEKHRPDAVFVDQTGIGSGVVDRLHQLGQGVIGIDFGSRPLSGKFLNRRVEMWHKMADWVREGGCIPDDPVLRSELPGPTYHFAPDGRMVLESKDEMKRRGVASPNRADALALTFAAPVAAKGLFGHGRSVPRAKRDFDPYA